MAKKTYGFIQPKIKPEDYIRGHPTLGGKVPENVLQPDSNWLLYLPLREDQIKNVETNNCTAFGTLNALEILHKRKFGFEVNWCERALGIMAGTRPPGNDPSTVIETVRKQGALPEDVLPFTEDIDTVEKYYSPDPLHDWLLSQASNWGYTVKHEWVTPTRDEMIEALKHSPLGVAVYAWKEEDGFNVRGGTDNHWVCLYGIDSVSDGWLVFDSYAGHLKLLHPNYQFYFVKRYWLDKGVKKNWCVDLKNRLGSFFKDLVSFQK